jgi:hypothetical protein
VLYKQDLSLEDAISRIRQLADAGDTDGDLGRFLDFISASKRSIIR